MGRQVRIDGKLLQDPAGGVALDFSVAWYRGRVNPKRVLAAFAPDLAAVLA